MYGLKDITGEATYWLNHLRFDSVESAEAYIKHIEADDARRADPSDGKN